MLKMSDIERRRHRRFSVLPQYSRIQVTRLNGAVVEGHVHDVSASGVRFECDDRLGLDEAVEFEIELPGSAIPLSGKAHVVRGADVDDAIGPWIAAVQIEHFQTRFQSASLARFLEKGYLVQAA
jgi:hypothetical protein